MNENENQNENFSQQDNLENVSNYVAYIEPNEKEKNNKNIKTFVCGILGGLVGGVIIFAVLLSIPNIRNGIFETTENEKGEGLITNKTTPISTVNYENPVEGVAENVGPSVVGVTVSYSYSSFFGTQQATQEGSGIIIGSNGYILTNNHVVQTAGGSNPTISVYLPNSTEPLAATIVGSDSETDIAVIKIDCTDLPAVTLGNSSDLKVGEMVIAIGNPLGMEFAGSVTVGYVSALNRELSDSYGNTYTLIQTDAAINEGNSGGALVNSNGEVIGINTAKIGGSGIEGLGFAIPIDDIKDVINDLITYKKVIRPYMGIEGTTVDETTKERYSLDSVGVYIRFVEEFSAAEIAGLRAGDIITKIDGTTVESMEKLNEIKNSHKVGDKLEIVVVREKQEKTFTLTLKEQN